MIDGLAKFLRESKDKIMRKERVNVVRKTVGYSEYTQWDTTVSFDEIEVVDFDKLMVSIEEFEQSFKVIPKRPSELQAEADCLAEVNCLADEDALPEIKKPRLNKPRIGKPIR